MRGSRARARGIARVVACVGATAGYREWRRRFPNRARGEHRWRRGSKVRLVVAAGVMVAGLIIGSLVMVGRQSLMRRDDGGSATVRISLVGMPADGASPAVNVDVETHRADPRDLAFEHAVVLRTPGGHEVVPLATREDFRQGFRRKVQMVFPPIATGDEVRIVVRNVGGVGERVFSFSRGARP